MAYYIWDDAKNQKLKAERNVCFEDVVWAIDHGYLLGTEDHPHPEKYGGQQIMMVALRDYVYMVPFKKSESGEVVLKTIIPSRKATKIYLGKD